MEATKIMTVEQMKDEAAWLEMRKLGIGGSEASAACNMNHFKSQHALWLEKTGQVEPDDLSHNEFVYWGHKLEPLVAERFMEITGKKVCKCGLLQNKKYPFIMASVDRLVVGESAGLECKTTSGFKAREWDGDEVPDEYYIQCQHYLLATGLKRWYIAVLIGGNRFIWKTIERNEDDIQMLLKLEKSFWTMVQNNIEPPIDGSPSSNASLLKKYSGGKTEPVELPEVAEHKAQKLLELQEQEKDLKIDIAHLQNELKEQMGDNEVGYRGNYQFTWATVKGRSMIDSKKLKAEKPNIYMDYLKVGNPTRRFSVKYVE